VKSKLYNNVGPEELWVLHMMLYQGKAHKAPANKNDKYLWENLQVFAKPM